MHIRLLAVGERQPAWVDEAFDRYAARLPREWRFRCESIATARRSRGGKADKARRDEGARLLSRIDRAEQAVLLDERGKQMSSRSFADRLAGWQTDGRDLTFVIGGPDGFSDEVRKRADFTWSLSSLTMPHGLVRVLFIEQLYRAWSLHSGHPYHRD